jgi:hypothetical protein
MTFEDLTEEQKASLKGDKGDTGTQGPQGEQGIPGLNGEDGFSPIIIVTPIDNGYSIFIKDKNNEDTVIINNGADGKDGATGAQGQAGEKGQDGEDGKDGDTPFINENGYWQIGDVITNTKAKGDTGEQGPAGPVGPTGPKGNDGTGVNILGSYDTIDDLIIAHPSGNIGEAYIVAGDLHVWNQEKNNWINVGKVQGPQGEKGEAGIGISNVEIQDEILVITYSDGNIKNLGKVIGPTGATG